MLARGLTSLGRVQRSKSSLHPKAVGGFLHRNNMAGTAIGYATVKPTEISFGRRATLAALHAFLSWIPLGYIFESNLVEILLKHFPQPAYRNLALQCLTEVGYMSWA
jgi:Exportin 1-like protein